MRKGGEYQALYLMQFIFAIFIVVGHVGSLTDIPELHFFLKSMIARLVVPFFILNNIFFYAQKDTISKKTWMKKNIKYYLIWSLVYLPFGIQFIQEQIDLPLALYPVALLVGFVYTGTFYHLWYFPALFFGIFVLEKVIRRWGYLKPFFLLLVLYIIGASETYSSYLEGTFFRNVMDQYFAIFLTTRNAIFYTGIFILIGFYLAENYQTLLRKKHFINIGLVLSLLAFSLEAVVVYANPGRDKNFLFALIPVIFFLFLSLLNKKSQSNYAYLRKYGQGIFFIHMIPIQLFNIFVTIPGASPVELGLIRFILGVGVSILVIDAYEHLKEPLRKLPELIKIA